jgi:MarR family transcriptional regulator, organic hydroperoxide resistance regulator
MYNTRIGVFWLNDDIFLELRSNVQKFVRLFGLLEQNVTPCGFPLSVSQVFAMQELEKGTMSVTELASRLELERSSVSRLVDELVKGEFISRNINEANRREMILSLTEKGMRNILQVRQQSLKFYQSVLGSLSNNEQTLIIDGFKKFTGALLENRRKKDDK